MVYHVILWRVFRVGLGMSCVGLKATCGELETLGACEVDGLGSLLRLRLGWSVLCKLMTGT